MSRLMSEVPNCKGKVALSVMDPILHPGHFHTHELEATGKSERPESSQL